MKTRICARCGREVSGENAQAVHTKRDGTYRRCRYCHRLRQRKVDAAKREVRLQK